MQNSREIPFPPAEPGHGRIHRAVAELRRLATHYKFGGYLSEALRDMLVCGLKSESTQKRLLAETELTLAKAVEIAQSMEAADHNAQQLKGDDLRVAQVRRRHVQQRPAQAENQENPDNQRKPCYHCGGRSHAQRECRFKDVLCHNCGKKGHLAKVCLSGRQNNRRGGRVSQLQETKWVGTTTTGGRWKKHQLTLSCK